MGRKLVIVGAGMKVNPSLEAVPPGVVNLTEPLEPLPTIATIDVEETTVKEDTGVPPKVTIDVPLKLLPVMLMIALAAAITGSKDEMKGAGIKVNPSRKAVPPGVVKLTAPVEPVPTTARIESEETMVKELTAVPPRLIA
jgi:hypothetical protein